VGADSDEVMVSAGRLVQSVSQALFTDCTIDTMAEEGSPEKRQLAQSTMRCSFAAVQKQAVVWQALIVLRIVQFCWHACGSVLGSTPVIEERNDLDDIERA